MSKTKIEYLTHCWNFYTGCLHLQNGVCPVGENCWAYTMAQRFNKGDFKPRLHPELLLDPLKLKKPSRIGVCFTGDLFGDWVDPEKTVEPFRVGDILFNPNGNLRKAVFDVIEIEKQSQFFFLTKAPENIQKWGTFPDNAWVGASATNSQSWDIAFHALQKTDAKNKWLSFEPLCEYLPMESTDLVGISWIVIGGQSGRHPIMPKIEWIREIIDAADKAGIPVFLKNNLRSLLIPEDCHKPNALMDDIFWTSDKAKMRQELPED